MRSLRALLFIAASSIALAQTITTTSPLPTAAVGVSYIEQLSCSNCSTPVWTGTPPPGLGLDSSSGVISGVPTTASTFTFVITETNAGTTQTTSKSFQLTVVPNTALKVTTTSFPDATLGLTYNSPAFTASGGFPPYDWSIPASQIPPGLGLATTPGGTVISGVPTQVGSYPLTLTVVDSHTNLATAQVTLTVDSGAAITTSSLPNGVVNSPYSGQLTCTACTNYTWSINSGTLPPVLSISPTGAITGTPTTVGTYNFVVKLSSGKLTPLTQALSISINPPLSINAQTLPVGTVNVPYSTTITAVGGSPPYAWSFTSTQNDGLTINATTGVLSGTPITGGQFSVSVQATDSGGLTATRLFTLYVASTLSVTTASLPNGSVSVPYPTQTLAATGGQQPYRWSISTGTLPQGLNLNATQGLITGTPTATGTSPFTLVVTDTLNNTASAKLSITVVGSVTITITPSILPGGNIGTAYSQTLTAAGGTAPYTWTVVTGAASLPAGLAINASTGVISGTPTAAGSSAFTIQATDVNGANAEARYSVVISASPTPLTITTTTLPAGITGVAYSQTLAATGGIPPYKWAVTTGTLPAGLGLNAVTGAITGTPTATGTSPFTVTVTDSTVTAVVTAKQAFSIVVTAPLTLSPSTLPNASVGAAYSQTLTAAGGTPPYKFGISAGALPAGFSLNASTGIISGTPTTTESGSFLVTVTDSANDSASEQLSLTVTAPVAPTVTLTGVPTNSGFMQQLVPTLTTSGAYPAAINGTITLTFTPSVTPSAGVDDLMIQFSNGSRTINFTIPAGSTTPSLTNAGSITVLTGTTAGTITLTTTLTASGASLGTPTVQTIVNNAGVPFISNVSLAQVPGGVTVTVTGFSSTRDMTNGQFAFVPGSGDSFSQDNISVAVNQAFATWYSNTAVSNQYGTQFTLTVPFTMTTPAGNSVSNVVAVSVTVTLANSKGASNPVTLSQ